VSGTHSNLGASSSKRWINCPGSVRLIGQLPPAEQNRSSWHAREGNAAHHVAATCLSSGKEPEAYRKWVVRESMEGEWSLLDPKTKVGANDFTVNDEMIEAVQEYIDSVKKSYTEAGRDAVLHVEVRVKPLEDREDMYGTADAIVVEPFGQIWVHDLKYGKGVQVEAERNSQTMYYGLGAVREVGGWQAVEDVELVINQPRAGGERRFTIPSRELSEWGDTLRAAADRTRDPKAPLAAGDWCRFCPMAGNCPELNRKGLEIAQERFKAAPLPSTLPGAVEAQGRELRVPSTPEEVSLALRELIPVLDIWARETEGQAQRLLERGVPVPGFKLVRKRANRQWADEPSVADMLALEGLTDDDMYEKSLRSPAQIEKITKLGKPKHRKDVVGKLTIKPEGGLTLADENDARPAERPPVARFEAPVQAPLLEAGRVDNEDLLA
jgi:hypothetical protein